MPAAYSKRGSKAHIQMMKKGMIGVKPTQAGAINVADHAAKKKAIYAYNRMAGVQGGSNRKLLCQDNALCYGRMASMKTRK